MYKFLKEYWWALCMVLLGFFILNAVIKCTGSEFSPEARSTAFQTCMSKELNNEVSIDECVRAAKEVVP